jgi:hypothetical protein
VLDLKDGESLEETNFFQILSSEDMEMIKSSIEENIDLTFLKQVFIFNSSYGTSGKELTSNERMSYSNYLRILTKSHIFDDATISQVLYKTLK